MAFTEALRLIIDADSRGAVRGIEQVGRTTDKELGKSTKTIDKWSRGLTVAGAGMVALGGAALFGLGKAAMASEEAEQGFRKLQNSIANNPRLAAESANAFRDLAESIQDKTAADADSIVAGQAVLAQRKLDAAQIKELTPLVVDLARKKGIDEVAAFTLASKAVDGNAGALKRAGISVDEAAFKSDAFGATVEALRSSVGGYAEEEGKTFQGSLERLKNQMGDLVEGVGAGAVDAFGDLFGVVGGGVEKLNELSPATQNVIGKVATFGSVALVAAGGLSFMIGQAITMRQRFGELADAVSAARLRFAGLSGAIGPLGVGAALLAAGTAFALYLKQQNEAKIAAAAEAFAKLRDVTRESAAETLKLNDAVVVSTIDFTASASAADTFAKTGEITNQVMRDLDKHWDEIISKSPQFAEGFIRNAEEIGVSRDKLAEWRGELDKKIATDQTAVEATDAYNAAVQGTTDETEEATSALQEYSDMLRAMTDPLFAAMDAVTGVRDAQLAEKDAAVAVMEAQAELNEARAKGNEDEVAEATRNLEDAQRDLSDAQWATVESAAEADSALAGLKDAVERGDVSVSDFRATLRQWVAQGFLTQAQADAAAGSIGSLARQADIADSKRIDIPATVRDNASGTVRLIQQRINNLTGKTVTVSVVASYTASASNALQTFGGRQAGGGVVPRYMQSGGVNWSMGAGPRGFDRVPAWLTPGELILNTGQQGKLFRAIESGQLGGGSAVNVHVHVEKGAIVANDPEAVATGLLRHLRHNGAGQLRQALGMR